MRYVRAGLVGLGLLVLASDLHSQVVIGPPGGFGYSNRRFSISIGGPGYYSPYYGGYGASFSGVTIYSAPPQVIYSASPIVVRPPAPQQPPLPPEPPVVNNIRDEDFPDKIIIRPRNQQVRNDPAPRLPEPMIDDRPLPGAPAGEFRPLRPEERARVQPEEPRRGPQVPEQREADPRAEHARQIALGRFAFAGREYARAERRFQEAVRVVPREPIGHFLLAQAQFALGKYREASASIHAGLRIDPEWPTLKFRGRDLYAENLTDFTDHLKAIEAALLKHPDDPAVLFVYAYQLWFDGRQDEARPLLRRASRLVLSPFFIELFLLAQPGGPVAQGL